MLSPSVNSLKFQPCDHPSIPLSFSLANPKTRPYSLKLKGIDRSYLCLALVSFRRSHSWKEVVSFRQFLSVSALRPPSLLPVSGPGEFPRVESAYAAGSTPDSVNCFKFQPCGPHADHTSYGVWSQGKVSPQRTPEYDLKPDHSLHTPPGAQEH